MKYIYVFILVFTFLFKESFSQISIQDSALVEAIKNALNLDSASTIQQVNADTLYRLDASNYGIIDLSGIESFRHLKTLYLNNNQIVDLTPLSHLPELDFLNISQNKIEQVAPLTNATSPNMTISLRENCINDFEELENNWLMNFNIIGKDEQKIDCNNEEVTILYHFDATVIDEISNEVKFFYRGWSNYNSIGNLDFGDGNQENAICNASSQVITHNYSSLENIIAKLQLNGEELEIELSNLFSSIVDIPNIKNYKLYPNPTSDFINLEFVFDENVDFSFRIYDVNGNKILTNPIETKNYVNQRINLKNSPSGIYFIFVDINNKSYSYKIIVSK